MKITKKIVSVLLCVITVLSIAACGKEETSEEVIVETENNSNNTMQEQVDVTRNHVEKITDDLFLCDGIEFYKDINRTTDDSMGYNGYDDYSYDYYQGYSYKNTPSSIIAAGNHIFYITEDMELHSVYIENCEDKTIAQMHMNPQNIIYSNSYMLFFGSVDGYNYSYYLYNIKNDTFIDNDAYPEIFSSQIVGLYDNYLCYAENDGLRYRDLTDNSIKAIYTPTGEKDDDTADWLEGCITDVRNNCLYYRVGYTYYDYEADGRINGVKLFRYDFTDNESREEYDLITRNWATDEYSSLPDIYAVNGSLCTFKYDSEVGIFDIENGKITKNIDFLPGEDFCLIDNIIYYKSNDKNVIINGDNMITVDEALDDEAGFLGCFNDSYWYSTEYYLCTLKTETNELAAKVLFNGFIIDSDNDTLLCYGKPVEMREVTDVYGNKSTSYEEAAEGVYKVSINDIETEQEYIDVFSVSENDKTKALSILDGAFGTQLMLLVKSPSISTMDTTYDENLVSVVVSGKFRLAKDVWADGTVIFSVNISDNSCRASGGSIPWSTIISAYNNGI